MLDHIRNKDFVDAVFQEIQSLFFNLFYFLYCFEKCTIVCRLQRVALCYIHEFSTLFQVLTKSFINFSLVVQLFSAKVNRYWLYLGSWRHLSVKIFGRRCSLKNFRDETYMYIELIYQISAQSDTWNITGGWGQVLAPFT